MNQTETHINKDNLREELKIRYICGTNRIKIVSKYYPNGIKWTCDKCTFENTKCVFECEICDSINKDINKEINKI